MRSILNRKTLCYLEPGRTQLLTGSKQFIKAYFYSEDSIVRKSSSGSWPSFIAKTDAKWYPHESIIEYMINRIGQVLNVNMNEVKLVKAVPLFIGFDGLLLQCRQVCGTAKLLLAAGAFTFLASVQKKF
ncbi:MAG TPA: hypothetical protein VFW07_17215 [Parafilimonas sp.]|nr:hypothetical protein [Parafilimonas sp.]